MTSMLARYKDSASSCEPQVVALVLLLAGAASKPILSISLVSSEGGCLMLAPVVCSRVAKLNRARWYVGRMSMAAR